MHSLQAARSKAAMVVKHWFTLEHSVYWCRRLDQVNAPAGDARYTLINAILATPISPIRHAIRRWRRTASKGSSATKQADSPAVCVHPDKSKTIRLGARHRCGVPTQIEVTMPKSREAPKISHARGPSDSGTSQSGRFLRLNSRIAGCARISERLCPQLSEAALFRSVRGRI